MQPNSRQLAMRDVALASLLGVVPGANFGHEASFSGDFSADFGDEMSYETYQPGSFGVDAMAIAPKPTPQEAIQAYQAQHAARVNQSRRTSLLNPNQGSNIKVERYSFTIAQALTIGTAGAISMNGNPDTTIRPQILMMNAPSPMFATIQEIKVANVSVTVGPGGEDAFNYSALAVGKHLDMPTLSPANRASILGNYTGYTPPGFAAGLAVTFSASFKGPATIAG